LLHNSLIAKLPYNKNAAIKRRFCVL